MAEVLFYTFEIKAFASNGSTLSRNREACRQFTLRGDKFPLAMDILAKALDSINREVEQWPAPVIDVETIQRTDFDNA